MSQPRTNLVFFSKALVLLVWKREDRGETEPSLTISAGNEKLLKKSFADYIRKEVKSGSEDYLEKSEYADAINEAIEKVGDCPELNCAYITQLLHIKIDW